MPRSPLQHDPLHLLEGFRTIDHRAVANPDRGSRGQTKKRDRGWSQIQAVMYHQTATDSLHPEHRGMLNLPAHFLIGRMRNTGETAIVLLHDVRGYVYHGHGGNRFSIGVEVQCRAAGLIGESLSFWRSEAEKNDDRQYDQLVREAHPGQLDACKAVLRYCAELVKLHGGEIGGAITHRQSARKTSDPGQRIARAVNSEARQLLPDWAEWTQRTWGKGRPQPDAWTGEDNGVAYSRKLDGLFDIDEADRSERGYD